MAAERSPFSEVPPKTDCQPEVGLRLGPRADADLSARRLNRTGPLPPHHGLVATPGGRGGRDRSSLTSHSFACGIRHRFRAGKSGTRRPGAVELTTARNDDNCQPIRTNPLDTYAPKQHSDRPAPVPATQNEPSTDYRFAAFMPTGPDRPSRTVTTWPRRLSRAENAGCSASRPICGRPEEGRTGTSTDDYQAGPSLGR
jgi:hypothetical protein